jgi:glycine/D-amino acid oxidase-like deaminating enzyme
MGYGPDEIYTRSAQRSLARWCELFDRMGSPGKSVDNGGVSFPLFQPTGVLWLAREPDPYCDATVGTLQRAGVSFEMLQRDELSRRYPQFELGPVAWGILEPGSGVLMARQAVQAIVMEAVANGAIYLEEAVLPPHGRGKLTSIATVSRNEIFADKFVFACGPWLPKLFPELLSELIYVTRQEVFFFGVPAGDHSFAFGRLPAWVDFNDLAYGIPNLDNRGFKIAIDVHGPKFDPDTGERLASADGLAAVRAYLAQRVPQLSKAPVTETRVCQYENSSNGDFLIDRHPTFENVWLVGGGSGHGFKHGPAVGEYVAAMVSGAANVEPRFALGTRERVRQRKVY